jgi:hypothetical protein
MDTGPQLTLNGRDRRVTPKNAGPEQGGSCRRRLPDCTTIADDGRRSRRAVPRCLVGFAQGSGRCRPGRFVGGPMDMRAAVDLEPPKPEGHSEECRT